MQVEDADDVAGLVTVVVTTSAVPQHPNTHMLEATLASCRQHASALHSCRKLIVCDGFVVKSDGESGRRARKSFRAGVVLCSAQGLSVHNASAILECAC